MGDKKTFVHGWELVNHRINQNNVKGKIDSFMTKTSS